MGYRIIALWGVAVLTALTSVAEVRQVSCTQTAPNRYRIEYSLSQPGETVQILASARNDGSEAQMIGTASTSPYEIEAGNPGERIFFIVKAADGAAQLTSVRRLPLQGAPNVRDLGGYHTASGKTVKWGLVYRAGELGRLTPADVSYLQQLNVKVICDFRTEEERQHLADRWPEAPAAEMLEAPIGTSRKSGSPGLSDFQKVLQNNPQPDQLQQLMLASYRTFVVTGAPEYSRAFRQIVEGKLPFLFHCTAGKDRTGLFSALLLLTLGVPRAEVTEDFLLSNQYLLDPRAVAQMTQVIQRSLPSAASLTPDAAKVLLGVDKQYLDAALDEIDHKYGSFDQYRRNALGVSDSDVVALQAALLTN